MRKTNIKIITLLSGERVRVSRADYNKLRKYRWHLYYNKEGGYRYAQVTINGKNVFMHRMIMGVTDSNLYVDHKDGDGLNNVRDNLRVSTNAQNQWNTKSRGGASKYKGVDLRGGNRWRARIRVNGKRYDLGYFDTEREAGLAYNEAVKKYHGEFGVLNDTEEDLRTDLT